MDLGLAGRSVLVGGASRGIGLAIARAYVAEGARVVLTARGAETLAAAATSLRREAAMDAVASLAGDVTTAEGARAAVTEAERKFGGLDVLVANVGSGSVPGGADRPHQEWHAVLGANLVGSMQLAAAALPALAARKGAIVFVTSIAGTEDIGAPLTYAAAKAGLGAAAKSLARLAAPDVRVNAVAPGNVLFPDGSWDGKLRERREEIERMIRDSVPLRRFGTPDEIASAVLFLSSSRASFITGSCLVVDGGQTRAW